MWVCWPIQLELYSLGSAQVLSLPHREVYYVFIQCLLMCWWAMHLMSIDLVPCLLITQSLHSACVYYPVKYADDHDYYYGVAGNFVELCSTVKWRLVSPPLQLQWIKHTVILLVVPHLSCTQLCQQQNLMSIVHYILRYICTYTEILMLLYMVLNKGGSMWSNHCRYHAIRLFCLCQIDIVRAG